MDSFPEMIRKLREEKKLPLRTVAAFLNIDQAILSKIERGQRKATRAMVVKLATYFESNEEDLLVAWLSDKLVYELADEQVALKALQVAEEKVAYKTSVSLQTITSSELQRISSVIKNYFQSQNIISKAWLFGSYARGTHTLSSDIDVLIDVPFDRKFTLFDIAEVQHELKERLNVDVDVVMLNGIRQEVKDRIKNEMLQIYEA
jgi:predicted nucleotidyltransferase/plasmid maintenance system antidote protein VapI